MMGAMLDGATHTNDHTGESVSSPTHAGAEDPVLAALRRAPLAPPDVRARLLALDAEVTSDPRTWQSMEHFEAKVAAEHARRQRSR
jgi:3-oxoacyl-(acyl-carrier-protein) synthase